jgi:hypothetical protein
MRRNLVVARVGRGSLHPSWFDKSASRNWDLFLCPFQDIPDQEGLDCVRGDVIPGPKWTGLTKLLNSWDGWRDYDYVWLPDDDLFAPQSVINMMFDFARQVNFALFAPGLHESSYYAHFIAMRNKRFFARRVGFVEIMAPCFSRNALEQLLPTFSLSSTGWGWGLDSLWPKLLGYEGLGIIDACPVLHTRPVGQFRDAELGRRVMEESDRILRSHDCSQRLVTFDGVSTEFQDLKLPPDELLSHLVRGWDYLLPGNPRLLNWIVEHQRPHFHWPPYPAAGSPTGPG